LKGFFRIALDTLTLLRKNHALLFLILLFDVLFVLSYVGLNMLWNLVFPSSQAFQEMLSMSFVLWISSVLVIVYLLLIAVIYSLFKYCVLHNAKSYFHKEAFTMANFRNFFAFNIIIFVVLMSYYLLVSYFAFSFVNMDLIGMFGIITLLPIAYFAYPYINACQMITVKEKKARLKDVFMKGFAFLKEKIGEYSKLYMIDIVVCGIYFAFFLMLTALLNTIWFKDDQYSAAFTAYQGIFIFLTLLFLWIIVIYNRIYLCSLVERKE